MLQISALFTSYCHNSQVLHVYSYRRLFSRESVNGSIKEIYTALQNSKFRSYDYEFSNTQYWKPLYICLSFIFVHMVQHNHMQHSHKWGVIICLINYVMIYGLLFNVSRKFPMAPIRWSDR